MESSRRRDKKEVRFSSPFETESVDMKRKATLQPVNSALQPKTGGSSSAKQKGSSDSWDAFDAQMLKTKKGPAKEEVHNQFLELSSCQNKSLNVVDEDFSAISFQDAKDLIEKDENERLQFMNSDLSFSGGIDQVEPPSLLSVTNYFQQGSSFPVPYVGNDSTMFGENCSSFFLPSTLDDTSKSQTEGRRGSSNQHRRNGRPNNDLSRKESLAIADLVSGVGNQGSSGTTDLTRNDSLAKFFLGSQSDGMNKSDIMDYVLDYCKRRASLRLSDVSEIVSSRDNSTNSSTGSTERHDSGIGIGGDEKTLLNNGKIRSDRMESKFAKKDNVSSKTTHRVKEQSMERAVDNEESVLIADAATMKETDMDVSDVGGAEGFERFIKRLPHQVPDRFKKAAHHQEFEKKRLALDERFCHPQLSPMAFNGPGATATLERPSKKLPRNSPPEKLARRRIENVIDDSSTLLDVQTPGTRGPCHSTPVALHDDIGVPKMGTRTLRSKEFKNNNASKKTDSENTSYYKENNLKNTNSTKPQLESCNSASSDHSSRRASKDTPRDIETRRASKNAKCTDTQTQMDNSRNDSVKSAASYVSNSKPKDAAVNHNVPISTHNNNQMQVIQSSSDGLSVVPVIQSAIQQHTAGTPTCTCAHQCGQQHGLHSTQGLPIVIHIHLPCAPPMAGTVAHTVPTTSSENSKM